jgi:hypothetical protein
LGETVITQSQRRMGTNPQRVIVVSESSTYAQSMSSKAVNRPGRFPREGNSDRRTIDIYSIMAQKTIEFYR